MIRNNLYEVITHRCESSSKPPNSIIDLEIGSKVMKIFGDFAKNRELIFKNDKTR
jgi:hypothetical protein